MSLLATRWGLAGVRGDVNRQRLILSVPVVTGRDRGDERSGDDRRDDGVTFHRCAACKRQKTPGELFFHCRSRAQAPALYARLDGVN